MFITADFVKLTEEIDQKHKIQHYIKNYWTLFSLVSFGVLVLAFIFPKVGAIHIHEKFRTICIDFQNINGRRHWGFDV
jgi:hypothetical protein